MPRFGRRDSEPRSAAEREAARLERLRRRAEREGRGLPADADVGDDGAAPEAEAQEDPEAHGDFEGGLPDEPPQELSPEPYTGADEHVERAEEDAARGSQENDVPREEQAVEPWA
ncbi:MAG: hypothetical protein QOH46_1493, partial [Solirubrobacteraceae bacterium]|nr:hypothetical protein [Solirubrobacteraceae bacterium]